MTAWYGGEEGGHIGFSPVAPLTGRDAVALRDLLRRARGEGGRPRLHRLAPPRERAQLHPHHAGHLRHQGRGSVAARVRHLEAARARGGQAGLRRVPRPSRLHGPGGGAVQLQRPRVPALPPRRSRTRSTRTGSSRRASRASGRSTSATRRRPFDERDAVRVHRIAAAPRVRQRRLLLGRRRDPTRLGVQRLAGRRALSWKDGCYIHAGLSGTGQVTFEGSAPKEFLRASASTASRRSRAGEHASTRSCSTTTASSPPTASAPARRRGRASELVRGRSPGARCYRATQHRPGRPRRPGHDHYLFQIAGPTSLAVLERATGREPARHRLPAVPGHCGRRRHVRGRPDRDVRQPGLRAARPARGRP